MNQGRTALISLIFTSLSYFTFANAETPKDSLGIERKGNKILVLHKVEPGQTLSVLARLYHTTLTDIKAENPSVGDDIQPGQIVKVPYQGPSKAGTATAANVTINTATGLHTVATGETLFGIARSYNVSVDDLRKWNGLADNTISIGDELAVSAKSARKPVTLQNNKPATGTTEETPIATAQPKSGNKKTHTVAPSQTLMAISRMYKVSLGDLRKWNNLTTDNLAVGQELIIEDNPSVTTYNTNTEESAATDEPRSPKEKEPEPEKLTVQPQPEKVEEPAIAKPIKKEESKVAESGTGYSIPNAGSYEKKVETGLAELIEGTSENEKYLALHRTAPIGTIVQVKNLMNDLSVFVKVVGKLQDTGPNDKIVIKLSQKAYARLAAVDKKFRVEVSYIP